MLETLLTVENLVALATLTALEIVLGIDNIIFISILSNKLPPVQRTLGRQLGIGFAVVSRIILLFTITWIAQLTQPFFTVFSHAFSGRDLILLAGGLFLIGKSTFEIHERLEASERERIRESRPVTTLAAVIAQIIAIDMVFSIDSVVTAVGISGELVVMIPAVVIAAAVMLIFAGIVARFVERHPTLKILALAFLILIGALLVIEGWHAEVIHRFHLKNYAYFAMAFSFAVELINMKLRGSKSPVKLHNQPRAAQLHFDFDGRSQA